MADQDDAVLETLIQAAYINNFPSALSVQLLSVHYKRIQRLEEGVPVAILYGDVACGKSRILDACLSLMGTADSVKSCSDGQFIKLFPNNTWLGV